MTPPTIAVSAPPLMATYGEILRLLSKLDQLPAIEIKIDAMMPGLIDCGGVEPVEG